VALTDFIYASNQGSGVFTTGISGSTVAHSALPSPLQNNGNYCRYWRSNYGSTGYVNLLVAANISGFKSIPSTKAVSVRAWLRPGAAASGRPGYIGLVAKASSATTLTPSWGYNFYIFDNTNFAVNFGSIINTDFIRKYANPTGGSLYSNWTHMRMDVIPVKNTSNNIVADRVRCFVGDGNINGETWTLVSDRFAEATVPSGITPQFKSWASATDAYYGFGSHGSEPGNVQFKNLEFYADNLEILTKTI
jgi:hypothetical protein